MKPEIGDRNLAYHAARLLLLLRYCGKPQGKLGEPPGVLGRTLLAKLDFFLRYPTYLKRARGILRTGPLKKGTSLELPELGSIESRMVRYLYGPWDHIYYPTLAYLLGKRLIEVENKRQAELFRLTGLGVETAERLANDDAYTDLVGRAQLVYALFHAYTGTGLKNFIYEHFPEVVGRHIGETI